MIIRNLWRSALLLMALFAFITVETPAQSPNTATMIVVVVDQNGAVVSEAKVSVVNAATGDAREVVSGSDGSATIPALSLTGTYTVGVSKDGFGNEERGPSLLDQCHRAVLALSYRFPYNITAGTLTQLASARPFNATTGIDNNGDGANNDRPVING